MPAKTLMIQGTASHVGKSVLVTALCRLFRRRGVRVAPFKAQNMSNNSFVTCDGREIGRAQAVQALACGLEPRTDFNPVLIKPNGHCSAQLVVHGRVVGALVAADFGRVRRDHAQTVDAAFARLASEFDLVVLEGAGSPAEINLRDQDVVNMYMARAAKAPVLLVGDIDRGGVFAALVGTHVLLEPEEQRHVKGVIINKFRGEVALLRPGLEMLTERSGLPCLGVVPHWDDSPVPEEDSLGWNELEPRHGAGEQTLVIGVVDLPAISNATDFEALGREPDVRLVKLSHDTDMPLDLLIFPGTKNTACALQFVRERGLDRLARRVWADKKLVVGICGGYQILGSRIRDPRGIESPNRDLEGLGLLDVVTSFARKKILIQVVGAEVATQCPVQGYQVHMGRTRAGRQVLPWFQVQKLDGSRGWTEGAVSPDGRVHGTYMHGLFDSPTFRRSLLNRLRVARGWGPLGETCSPSLEQQLDDWADFVAQHVDLDRIEAIIAAGIET